MTTTANRRQQLETAAAQGATDYRNGIYDPFATIPGAYDDEDSPLAAEIDRRRHDVEWSSPAVVWGDR